MSFHSAMLAAAVWPADLVTAGVAPTAAAVYPGRRPQKVTRVDREIWIERVEGEPIGTGFHGAHLHSELVHVIEAGNPDGDTTGKTKLSAAEADLRVIVKRYDGAEIPAAFSAAVPGLFAMQAQEEVVDLDPGEKKVLIGSVRVDFWEKE